MEALLHSLYEEQAASERATSAAREARASALASLAAAKQAAAKAARSLTASLGWVEGRRRRLDALVLQLRASGADSFTLLGETLEALRLAKQDASVARERALLALGLKPLSTEEVVRKGRRVVVVGVEVDGGDNVPMVEGVAVSDSLGGEVLISISGAPAVAIPREELAEWLSGGADDFGADVWSWMGAMPAAEPTERGVGTGRPKKRRKR